MKRSRDRDQERDQRRSFTRFADDVHVLELSSMKVNVKSCRNRSGMSGFISHHFQDTRVDVSNSFVSTVIRCSLCQVSLISNTFLLPISVEKWTQEEERLRRN